MWQQGLIGLKSDAVRGHCSTILGNELTLLAEQVGGYSSSTLCGTAHVALQVMHCCTRFVVHLVPPGESQPKWEMLQSSAFPGNYVGLM